MEPRTLHRTILARAEELAPLRHEVAAYARELGVADPFAVELAVSETVTNAIVHAYPDAPAPGRVEVRAEPVDHGGALKLTVVDHGVGMKPRTDSPGIGVGLPMTAGLAKRFEVCDCPEGGTQVCMVFETAG